MSLVDLLTRTLLTGREELVARLQRSIDGAPAPRQALDHVSATAQTVALRALWLEETYDLARTRVLCVGDHDLTCLALALVNPAAAVAVVDIDDDVLQHIDEHGHPNVRCRWADLRFGLPESLRGWADVVVTDPPYTPEGVRLFLARGLQGLRAGEEARLVLAYGYGEQPALGLKVQQEITGLGLAYEAVLPGFNRYHGAPTLGSASDLYVLRPTARARRLAETAQRRINIYTHGPQSLEGGVGALAPELATALRQAAAGRDGLPVVMAEVAQLLGAGEPARAKDRAAVAVDLRADPGGALVRVLLAATAARVAVLVSNNHPDLVDERAQRALTDLLGARYRLRLRRSTPGPRLAIVEAERLDATGTDPVREVLERAHGKLGNTWREALIRASDRVLTRNEARERIRTASGDPELLEERLLALPRHRLPGLLDEIRRSV